MDQEVEEYCLRSPKTVFVQEIYRLYVDYIRLISADYSHYCTLGFLKDRVYSKPSTSLEDLKGRITLARSEVTTYILKSVTNS